VFVSAGIQETWITGHPSFNSPLTHAQFGVGMGIADLTEQISFRGELVLSMQGGHWKEEAMEGHTNMAYLNLPLVLRYQGESGVFGELGLQPGYLMGAKDHWSGGSENAQDWLNDFDLGIPIGVGYELKGNFGIGLRYILGVSNIMKGSADDKGHNAVLTLRATYTFNKNKK